MMKWFASDDDDWWSTFVYWLDISDNDPICGWMDDFLLGTKSTTTILY